MESTCVNTSLNLNVVSPSRPMDAEAEVLVEKLHRLSCENKRLTEMLTRMSENYKDLQKHLSQVLLSTNSEKNPTQTRKRKAETANCMNMFGFSGTSECSTSTDEESFKRPKDHITAQVSRVLVRTEAYNSSLYVRDGYQWRKYGQKVTRDNPSPRAYFKCSHAPSCPVKKKVQKSAEDPTVLVATYEGEHNHAHRTELPLDWSQSEVLDSVPVLSSMNTRAGPTVTLDLVQQSGLVDSARKSINQILVQQMATSLTRDPNFTSALSTVISGSILDQTTLKKW